MCDQERPYTISSRHLWEGRSCHYHFSVTVCTVMQASSAMHSLRNRRARGKDKINYKREHHVQRLLRLLLNGRCRRCRDLRLDEALSQCSVGLLVSIWDAPLGGAWCAPNRDIGMRHKMSALLAVISVPVFGTSGRADVIHHTAQ